MKKPSIPATTMTTEPTNPDRVRMDDIRRDASRYSSPAEAYAASAHFTKVRYPILGDDGKVWLVRPVDFAWLEAQGFESP